MLIPPLVVGLLIVALYLVSSIKILAEYERGVIFRLGKLLPQPKGPGVALVFFPIDRMAPGMGHCGGGPGPNQFDALVALEAWVEQGTAPNILIASHAANGKIDRTRPLCLYPQVARYKGSGSIDEAASFSCVNPSASPKKTQTTQ